MGIGTSVIRQDAVAKVTGQAKYVEDLLPRGALYAQVVHSTIANGTVRTVHTEKAKNMPGVQLVATCFDVPQHQYVTAGHPLSLDPAHADVADKTMLTSRVRFYGDDVAVVVADNQLNARLAAAAVQVEYDELPPLLTPDAAVGQGAIHEEYPDNQLARMDFSVSGGAAEFTSAPYETGHTIGGAEHPESMNYHTPPTHACHLENNSCFAYMENGRMVVTTCTQAPHTLRRNVASALGLPVGKVRILKPYMGGGFGNKQDTLYEPLAAWLSMQLGGRPVAILMSREETFVNSRTRHAFDVEIATKANPDTGKMERRAVRINANGGAYAAHAHAVAAYAVTTFFQTYTDADEQVGRSCTAYTNLPPAAAVRGYGIPQISFAMESQMDDMAKKLGIDPIDYRKKNMMQPGFHDPFADFSADSCGFEACLDKARALSRWDEKRKEYDAFNARSRVLKKGLGLAMFSYKTGVWPISLESAACRILLNEDGSGQIHIGATELGQGSDTVLAQIVSEILTIPESRLTVISTQDTDTAPYDNGAYASRQTYVSGGAAKKAALALREKILAWAAQMTSREPSNLHLEGGMVADPCGNTVLPIADVCRYSNFVNDSVTDTEHLAAEATYTCKTICFVYGVSVADIEVDVPVGKVRVKKILAVHDSGKILNPALAMAQLHGGIAMGVGYALGEQMLFDPKTGKPLNNNLLDYKIPTSMDIPEMECHFVETYEPSAPFGNKGLAEPPLIPQAPAIRNAVLHATGVGINTIPLNPERLVHAFREAGLIQD